MTADTEKRAPDKKLLAQGIGIYAVVWLCLLVMVCLTFGFDAKVMILLSVVAVPALVALRMLLRSEEVKNREWLFLAVLTVFVLGGSLYAVGYWAEIGLADNHAARVRFADLIAIADKDPAFGNVEFSRMNFKVDYFTIRGTVPTYADLERLKSLCKKYGFSFYEQDVIVSGDSTHSKE